MPRALMIAIAVSLAVLVGCGRKQVPTGTVKPISFKAPGSWEQDSDVSRGLHYTNPQNPGESFRLVLLRRTKPPRMTEKQIQEDLREITEAEKVELETLGSRRYFFEDSREVEMDGRKLYRHRYYLVERDSTASAKIAAIIYSIPAESSQTKEAIEMRGLLRSRLRDSTFGADR